MKSNPQKQPDLKPEAEVDMLDAEQTFPTEEEIALEVFPFANKFKIPEIPNLITVECH